MDFLLEVLNIQKSYFCLSVQLGTAINTMFTIVLALVIQILILINITNVIKDVALNPEKIFVLSNAILITLTIYVAGAYMFEGIKQNKKPYMLPFIILVPYVILLLVYIFIRYNTIILNFLDAETDAGKVGTYFLETALILFLLYTFLIAYALYASYDSYDFHTPDGMDMTTLKKTVSKKDFDEKETDPEQGLHTAQTVIETSV